MSQAPIGDRGQRYQVEGLHYETGDWEVMGWSDQEDGPLVTSARMWPRYERVRVRDRAEGVVGPELEPLPKEE